jgi:tyrosyl-tRNA synthetase
MATTFQSDVLAELAWRERIDTTTHEELDGLLSRESMVLYAGFDPSASSLHIGNLIVIMGLLFYRRHGHRPLFVAGGATGRIGDPSGKDNERELMSVEKIEANIATISAQLRTIFDRAMKMHPETLGEHVDWAEDWQAAVLNNYSWLQDWTFLDFLRDVGKHFRVNTMIAKDSVKARLEGRDQGLSFTEFSYMLIQGYDFCHLREHHECQLQIGGSDQWGNITAGTDLIRRKLGASAFGQTMPLLLDSAGKKFGKTAAGAVFLDPKITSPYNFYQYWINRDDDDMERLFKSFTFLAREEIESLQADVSEGRNRGEVQRRLAHEITWLVHGRQEADAAVRASRMLFGELIEGLDDASLSSIFADVPAADISREALRAGIGILELMVVTGLQPSKGAARRLLQQGGGYLNNQRVPADAVVTDEDLASESMLVLRAGKKKYLVVKVA